MRTPPAHEGTGRDPRPTARRRARAALVLAAAFACGTPSATASAADDGVGLSVTAPATELALGQDIPLTLTVRNGTDAACSLAELAAGSVRVESVTLDGEPVQPLHTHAHYEAGLPGLVVSSLREVEPGATVDVDWPAHTLGPDATGVALLGVTALPGGDAIRSHWPVDRTGAYSVDLRYEVAPVATGTCAGSSARVTVVLTVGDAPGPREGVGASRVALLVVGAVVLALLAAAVVLRRRRRPVAAGALVVVLAVGWTTASGPSAEARLDIPVRPPTGWSAPPDGFREAVARCREQLRTSTQHDPATRAYLDWVLDPSTPSVLVTYEPGSSGAALTPDPTDDPRATIIWWDHNSTEAYTDSNPPVHRDPCTALFHEMVHAKRLADPAEPPEGGWCGERGPLREEAFATLMENRLRVLQGLPVRTHYMHAPLPARYEDCGPPESGPPVPAGEGLPGGAESVGDPHLGTFDGVRYSPQAVGELVLVTADAGDLEVQVRQAPLRDSRTVAVTTAVAVRVGTDRVSFTLDADGAQALVVHVDGQPTVVGRGETVLPGGGTVHRGPPRRGFGPDTYAVRWPDGSVVEVDPIERSGLRVHVALADARAGTVRGLLGTDDGNAANDLVTRDGVVLPVPPSHEQLYGALVESWRTAPGESLLDHAEGESSETFTDRTFPDEVPGPSAAELAGAAFVCRAAGVHDPRRVDECALDVASSGQLAFAVAAADAEQRAAVGPDGGSGPVVPFDDAGTTVPLAGDRATVDVAPGAVARLELAAVVGQVLYVEASGATLPDGCSTLSLAGPSGVVRTGCLARGAGALDRTVVAEPGTYTLVVDPPDDDAGRVTLRVVTAVDDVRPGTLDGAPVEVTAAAPGALGAVTFDGAAGQVVLVEADAAAPALDGCGALALLGPDGAPLRTGCLRHGQGLLDATTLPASGRYTVVLDPTAGATGSVRLRLVLTADQLAAVTLGGPPVDVRLTRPGSVARLSFAAEAGRDVVVRLSGATLADQCGVVRLLGPDGREVRSGCLLDRAGELRHTVADTGEHVVVVDPRARETGAVTVSVG